MYQRLQRLKGAVSSAEGFSMEELDISESYLIVINALAVVEDNNAWIIASSVEADQPMVKRLKTDEDRKDMVRKLLTLKDLREEYRAELARMNYMLAAM